MNAQMWSHQTFCELMAHSPKQAFEYRHRVLGDPIPEQYLDEIVVESVEEVEVTPEIQEKMDEIVEFANKPAEIASSDTVADTDSENVETPVKKAAKTAKKA